MKTSFSKSLRFLLAFGATLNSLVSPHVMAGSSQPGTVVGWGLQAVPYVQPGTRFTNVAAGYYHGLALTRDGTVIGWGYNYSGGATTPGGLSNLLAIAAGGGYSLAPVYELFQTCFGVN
jgi:hypothetical protein